MTFDNDILRLEQTLNEEFKEICKYFRSFRLSLNPPKTKYIIFTNSDTVHNTDVHIYIDNNNDNNNFVHNKKEIARIKPTDKNPYYKYLGILMDPDFSFKYHINNISTKLSRALYILRQSKNFLTEKSLLLLYYLLFHCHLIYAAEVWSSASTHLINQLILKQKAAIRIITKSSYNAHTQPLFKRLEILPLESLIKYHKLVFFSVSCAKKGTINF